jgi:hypothetical protein
MVVSFKPCSYNFNKSVSCRFYLTYNQRMRFHEGESMLFFLSSIASCNFMYVFVCNPSEHLFSKNMNLSILK